MHSRKRAGLFLSLCGVVAAASVPAEAAPACERDPGRGHPLPGRSNPVCLSSSDREDALIVSAAGGLLYLEPQAEGPAACLPNDDGSCLLHRHDAPVHMVFCPDPAGSLGRTHDPQCLSSALLLGPVDTFAGEGRIDASVVVDPSGKVACPGSL
jgi:hypothetical protein